MVGMASLPGRQNDHPRTGLPDHTRNFQALPNTRVIAVADMFDELTHVTPDHEALEPELAMARLQDEAGRGLLTVVVVRRRTGLPGEGFFRLAAERGRDISDPTRLFELERQRVRRARAPRSPQDQNSSNAG